VIGNLGLNKQYVVFLLEVLAHHLQEVRSGAGHCQEIHAFCSAARRRRDLDAQIRLGIHGFDERGQEALAVGLGGHHAELSPRAERHCAKIYAQVELRINPLHPQCEKIRVSCHNEILFVLVCVAKPEPWIGFLGVLRRLVILADV